MVSRRHRRSLTINSTRYRYCTTKPNTLVQKRKHSNPKPSAASHPLPASPPHPHHLLSNPQLRSRRHNPNRWHNPNRPITLTPTPTRSAINLRVSSCTSRHRVRATPKAVALPIYAVFDNLMMRVSSRTQFFVRDVFMAALPYVDRSVTHARGGRRFFAVLLGRWAGGKCAFECMGE